MDKGGHLWYPETIEEIMAITEIYKVSNTTLFHIGVKNYSTANGIYFLDGSFSPGIPYFTRKYLYFSCLSSCKEFFLDGGSSYFDFIGGTNLDLMQETSCLILDPNMGDNKDWFRVETACPEAKGVCKYKLGIFLLI